MIDEGREPIFRFHSTERFHPLAVESVEELGESIEMKKGLRQEGIDLTALPEDGLRMVLPTNPVKQEKELQQGELAEVGYRREQKGGGLTWVQYWLWYLYNPKRIYVAGEHEGDWEFVQVGYLDGTPVCATTSQHRTGGSRWWPEVELHEGRPVIYVANDSHANFFKPRRMRNDREDEADGRGWELAAIEWREFDPAWESWPGRWGNSTGLGDSPESPGCQGNRWKRPHLYHSASEREA